MKLKDKLTNLRKDLAIMKIAEIKPNYRALGIKHNIDQRTVKKYHEGYEGKSKVRKKPSQLDKYFNEINDKFDTTTAKVSSIFKYFEAKYGDIGSYGNIRIFKITLF